jgi:hypothetical protein
MRGGCGACVTLNRPTPDHPDSSVLGFRSYLKWSPLALRSCFRSTACRTQTVGPGSRRPLGCPGTLRGRSGTLQDTGATLPGSGPRGKRRVYDLVRDDDRRNPPPARVGGEAPPTGLKGGTLCFAEKCSETLFSQRRPKRGGSGTKLPSRGRPLYEKGEFTTWSAITMARFPRPKG